MNVNIRPNYRDAAYPYFNSQMLFTSGQYVMGYVVYKCVVGRLVNWVVEKCPPVGVLTRGMETMCGQLSPLILPWTSIRDPDELQVKDALLNEREAVKMALEANARIVSLTLDQQRLQNQFTDSQVNMMQKFLELQKNVHFQLNAQKLDLEKFRSNEHCDCPRLLIPLPLPLSSVLDIRPGRPLG